MTAEIETCRHAQNPAGISFGSICLITSVPVIGLIMSGIAFYPGYMSPDSIGQYAQSLARHFSDKHPPIMAFLWSLFDRVWTGPQLMLFVQLALFWAGAYLWLRAIAQRVGTAALIPPCALLFLPSILNFLGVIWSDVQLASAWSFAMAAVFCQNAVRVRLARTIKAALLCLVVYGGLVRHNAALAAGPIVLYVLSGRGLLKAGLRTIAAYLMIGLLVILGGRAVALALHAEHYPELRSVIFFDLAGMSFYENTPLFPFQVSAPEWDRLKQCHGDDSKVDPLIYGDCKFAWPRMLSGTNTDSSAIRFWLSTIASHPLAYIVHRLTYTRDLFSFLTPQASSYIWQPGIRKNDYGLTAKSNVISLALQRYVSAFSQTVIFRLYAWLLASVVVLAASFYRHLSAATANFARCAGITSLMYLPPFAIVGPSDDFRYGYVSIILTVFGGGAIIAEVVQYVLDRMPPGWSWLPPKARRSRV